MTERRLTVSDEEAARIRIVDGLADQRGEAAIEALVGHLSDRSWTVRRSVIAALARLGPAVVPRLARVLREQRDDENRLAAVVDALSAARGGVAVDEALIALVTEGLPAPLLCDYAQVLGRRWSAASIPLLTRLASHLDDNVAVAAVEALGRIGGPSIVDPLIALLGTGSFFRVFPAIQALGESGDARAVPPLVALLQHHLFGEEAVRALGKIGDGRAIPALTALLGAGPESTVRAAAVALAELHQRHTPAEDEPRLRRAIQKAAPAAAAQSLTQALSGADTAERAAIAASLGWLGDPTAVAGLFSLLDAEPPVAEAAIVALKRLRGGIDEQLARELAAAPSRRRQALLPLVGGRAGQLDAVLACLDDPDPGVRTAACEALTRSGDPRALPRVFPLLGDADARVAQAAVGTIQSLGHPDAERLTLEAARSPDPAIRRSAYRIIAYFGYPSGLEALLAGTEEPDPRLRETAIAGLAFLEDPRALTALLGATRSADAKLRAAAVRALGQRDATPESAAAVRVAVADPAPWVRYYACQALGRLRDESATAILIASLEDEAGQVRLGAVEALAHLGHPDAIAALGEVLRGGDADLRRAALVGLGQGQRPEAIPILLGALGSGDAATRLVVVSSLAAFDAPEVERALARTVGDEDASVRHAALELLGTRSGRQATQLLAGLLADPLLTDRVGRLLAVPVAGRLEGLVIALTHAEGETAVRLARAMARLHQPEAEAALVDLVRAGALPVRLAAAAALRELTTPAAREALQAAANHDPDPAVRQAAALALDG